MKTKIMSYLLLILIVPAIIGLFFQCFIAFDYWIGSGELVQKYINGETNNKLIAICGAIDILFLSVMITYVLTMIKYANKIDRLEEAATQYHNARMRYLKLADEFGKYIDVKLTPPLTER